MTVLLCPDATPFDRVCAWADTLTWEQRGALGAVILVVTALAVTVAVAHWVVRD